MGKLPALQLYPADWRKDPAVQSLNYHDRGVWFEILCIMHESSERGKLLLNGKAMPDEALARLLGLDNQTLTTTLTTLLDYGVASKDERTGALMNRRMVRDEEIRQIRKKVGFLGGNPILLKQKTTKGKPKAKKQVNQKSTPSSSSSSSSSNTLKTFDQFWSAYPKKKGKKPAQRAWVKLNPGPTLREEIHQALKIQKESSQWRKDGGEFIPHPATWLNQERWKDEEEVEEMTTAEALARFPGPGQKKTVESHAS